MARISHPNVISVYDVGTYGSQVFVAMEFIQGRTLSTWIRKEKHTVPEILRVFVEAGQGLVAAHKAGLVHRDFKPSNVLIGDNHRVCVLDFGLARLAEVAEAEEQALSGDLEGLEDRSEPHRARAAREQPDHGHAAVHAARAVPGHRGGRARRPVRLLRLAVLGAVPQAPLRAAAGGEDGGGAARRARRGHGRGHSQAAAHDGARRSLPRTPRFPPRCAAR